MFSSAKFLALVGLIPFVLAAPAAELSTRATINTASQCGQYESVTAGQYSLNMDQWGLSGATSGSDCAQLISLSGTTIAWKTTWTWAGNSGVKSFTDIQLNSGLNKQLSAIKSIPTTWNWSQSSTGTVVADVAYDLFTSNTPSGSNVNEVMIWLASFGQNPIAASYTSSGNAVATVTNISLAGHTWNLFSGSNGSNHVFSFLPASGTITSFSGDINVFLQYLTAHQGVSTSQYLKTAQAGTEAISGSATLTTSAYSIVIN